MSSNIATAGRIETARIVHPNDNQVPRSRVASLVHIPSYRRRYQRKSEEPPEGASQRAVKVDRPIFVMFARLVIVCFALASATISAKARATLLSLNMEKRSYPRI